MWLSGPQRPDLGVSGTSAGTADGGEVPVGAAACAMALHSSPQHICGPSGTIPMALWVLELQLWCLGPKGSGHPEWPCAGRVQAGAWGAVSAQGRSGMHLCVTFHLTALGAGPQHPPVAENR